MCQLRSLGLLTIRLRRTGRCVVNGFGYPVGSAIASLQLRAPVQRTRAGVLYKTALPVETASRRVEPSTCPSPLVPRSSQSLCCLSDRRHRGSPSRGCITGGPRVRRGAGAAGRRAKKNREHARQRYVPRMLRCLNSRMVLLTPHSRYRSFLAIQVPAQKRPAGDRMQSRSRRVPRSLRL